MRETNFRSEWVTIGDSRVYLECRAGFPSERMHLIANVTVEALKFRSNDAKLVSIFYDDKACVHSIKMASDNADDRYLEGTIEDIINGIFGYGNDMAEMIIVEPGNKDSDHYHHMEHLSVEAGIATDRWNN